MGKPSVNGVRSTVVIEACLAHAKNQLRYAKHYMRGDRGDRTTLAIKAVSAALQDCEFAARVTDEMDAYSSTGESDHD